MIPERGAGDSFLMHDLGKIKTFHRRTLRTAAEDAEKRRKNLPSASSVVACSGLLAVKN